MITGSKELIRDINSNLVLESIINSNPISRATISKNLGLTKATISAIVQELINKNLVMEIGSDDTSLGRKPILLSFNQNAGYAICIDLAVDTLSALISDLQGESCRLKQVKTPKYHEEFVPVIIKLVESLLEDTKNTPYGLVGITLGIHGVTSNNKIIFTPYYDLTSIDLTTELSNYFKVPVFVENEANLSVIGEKTFMYDYPNIVNISVHSGVGLGLMVDNELYNGFSGHAGEFGHTIIEIDGRLCPCGNHGCLEQYASERVLLQEFADLKGLDKVEFDYFSSMYQTGDRDAINIIHKFVKYMTVCVNNILNAYNPDIIIINSLFTIYFPNLITKIEASLTSRMNTFDQIVPSALQDTSILLGGICVAIKSFLGVNKLQLSNMKDAMKTFHSNQ
ncbi:ROK family transcriptional regulator [Anaeromicropila herbilytica]|uniref:Transcriptional regulator n=1 Tax=Anaeromicropila herbilytica TaxID=2785025 RepID=A0A7R7EPB4_9FIRM|nr:ROK family transcriptional regulator [Anaeromicropila herbilytica]BCN32147.1 transcriptional regulator [Anaeromicropila herbilytica]